MRRANNLLESIIYNHLLIFDRNTLLYDCSAISGMAVLRRAYYNSRKEEEYQRNVEYYYLQIWLRWSARTKDHQVRFVPGRIIMDKMNKNAITLGEIVYSDSNNMPQLEVVFGKVVGYLTPFRHYCFQVSATIDGDGDMGSSPIVRLDEVVNYLEDGTDKAVLKGLAMLALSRVARGFKTYVDLGGLMKIPAEDEESEDKWYNDKLEAYIDKAYTYLWQNM